MTERLTNPCRNCCESFNGERYSWLPICEHCKERITYEKCLKTAEEEGRLVVLPCKPGITLYILRKKYTKCSRHNEEFDESSCCGCEDECDSHLFYYIVPCPYVTAEQILEFERLGALNKKIFFSKEEADKALKEMEEKQDE